ncbi:SRPBCC family protein [Intrasporangium sp.]|uniref:SRPBCC family protein n=1 Tax=Intrasporangium sp. TaxID=1925024 RepID=UPI003221D091
MAKEFRVSRSVEIAAPPDRILPLLTDLHEWRGWSPWEDLDPNMERTYQGPARGVGAIYGWRGNGKAGSGRMEILEVSDTHVGIDLLFQSPMQAHNRIDFTLVPHGDRTQVEWLMTGPQNLVMRLMSRFWSTEKMVAPDFERGLQQLRRAVEAP